MLLYTSMVRSSDIIIIACMGDDLSILGAVVTLLEAMVYCCFWWCFYTSLWSYHHISSLYVVWEMMCQFWVQWWRFWRQLVTVVFYYVSIHHYGQIIIYHHCIWYGRWCANFGCSGDTFKGWWVTVVFNDVFYTSVWSDHYISSLWVVWEMTCQFRVQWWHFWRQWFAVVFDDVFIHHYGQIIIYHHCIWYGR